MPTKPRQHRLIPGLEVVGRGVYIRPNQPIQLKSVLFERNGFTTYYSKETGATYAVPERYEVNDSPPMPANQALNQALVEESWDRFEKRTNLSASAAVGNAPFSVDVNASQTGHLRQEEESYYAMRTSFIPLWTLYLPSTSGVDDDYFDIEIPTPFDPRHRWQYARFFEKYGTHYVLTAWVGGKANLALTISKQTDMSKADIQAGIKASMAAVGSASVSVSDHQNKEKLQSNSQCAVFGKGGDELKLAALSTLDNVLYNEWLATVRDNPQVIEVEVMGIWTLLRDRAKAQALLDAYKEETVPTTLRVVFNMGDQVHFFEDAWYCTYDLDTGTTSPRQRIADRWPGLFDIGFERVDAAFLGKYLVSDAGEDLSRKLMMFNRDKYVRWDLDSQGIDPGYPRLIRDGFPGVNFERLDAAINVSPECVYFFCGSQYVRYNTINHCADEGYPDLINRRWTGVTFDRIDAAAYWGNAKVYFFSGHQYLRYDTVMCRADPGFPRLLRGRYVEDWRFFE